MKFTGIGIFFGLSIAFLTGVNAHAGESGETQVSLPAMGTKIWIYTNSLEWVNSEDFGRYQSARLSRPLSLHLEALDVEAPKSAGVGFVAGRGLVGIGEVTRGDFHGRFVESSSFERVSFYPNGQVRTLSAEKNGTARVRSPFAPQGMVCDLTPESGDFIYFELFDNGTVKNCRLAETARIRLPDGNTIDGGMVQFDSPTRLRKVAMRKGRLETACARGKGDLVSYAGEYVLDAHGKIASVKDEENSAFLYHDVPVHATVDGHRYQQRTFQFSVRDCRFQGYLSVVLTGKYRHQGLPLYSPKDVDNMDEQESMADAICRGLGFDTWGLGISLEERLLEEETDLVDMFTHKVVHAKRGDRKFLLDEVGCSIFANID